MKNSTRINSLEELDQFADKIVAALSPGETIALSGPLGSGKTAFAQYALRRLGVKETITSPTFTLCKIYQCADSRIKRACHADVYRLENENEFLNIAGDYLGDPETVCFVEWAEKVKDLLPSNTRWLKFVILSDGVRSIEER